MVTQGVRTIVAVDVSSEDNNNLMDYGDHISGWWLLFKRFFPFGPKIRVCVSLMNFITIQFLYYYMLGAQTFDLFGLLVSMYHYMNLSSY